MGSKKLQTLLEAGWGHRRLLSLSENGVDSLLSLLLEGAEDGMEEEEGGQPRWTPQVPSSLRHPSLLPRNLPTSFCSVKKIDYFSLQLTSGPGSHH